ncbi:MAG: putative ABC transporter permease [Lachnospiraceae bacterium]|nr:putative ABC transporter permease [Lachnospiraceae bacterium]
MWSLYIFGIEFFKLFYCFMMYCVVGWIWETCYCSVKDGKLVNRGFLNGPVIPIYGCAATGIFLAFFNGAMISLATEKSWKSYLVVFILGAFVASALEYVTSYTMEKMFHAKWWDYSDIPLNINGRVCLPASLFWGLASIFLVKILHPFVLGLIDKMPRDKFEPAGYALFGLFLVDMVATVVATIELDRKITAITLLRKELNDISESLHNAEIKLRTSFKDKYNETTVGGAVSRTTDRIDATIAFTVDGVEQKLGEFDDARKDGIEEIDKVLAANKERTDKMIEENKLRAEKILKGMRGFQKYTIKRLMKAFPNMKPTGDRSGSLAMITTYLSGIRKKIGKDKRGEKSVNKPEV